MEPEEIRKLWRNPRFSGCYSGLRNFHTALKLEKNISIPEKDLFNILKQDRNYILEMRKVKKKINRRKMNIHGYGILWQADLGELYNFDGWIVFLLCIDISSRRIFARKLKSKRAIEVRKAFKSIFREANLKPEKLVSDQGQEFQSNASFF